MKLSELTPKSVADDCANAVREYVARLALKTCIGSVDTSAWDCGGIRVTAADLTEYAVRGAQLDAPAIDYVQSLAEALYVRPADDGTYETDDLIDGESATSWGLVIRAALARSAIESGDDVSPAQLAALASLDARSVRRLIDVGELRARKHRDDSRPGKPSSAITATEAKRWLSGRGVAGF